MKILISGHEGFIGSSLWKNLSVDNSLELFGLEKNESITYNHFDVVIHCGAIARTAECNDIFDAHKYNVNTTLDLLKDITFSRFIYISSCAVYGSHDEVITEQSALHIPSIYSAQKLYSEQMVKFFGETRKIPTCCLRLFNVYGMGQSQRGKYPNVIASMLRSVKNNNVVQVTGNGTQVRDFVHVDDVVEAIKLVSFGDLQTNSVIYNVCTSIGHDMNYITEKINNIFRGSTAEYIPVRDFDMYKQIGAYHKIYNDFGWTPSKVFEVELNQLIKQEYESI